MLWIIDTGVHGAAGCAAADLRKTLEDAATNFVATAPMAAKSDVRRRAPREEAFRDNVQAQEALALSANAAAAEVSAKLPKLQEQMKIAIDAACSMADHIGGKVTATCTGHYFAGQRVDGIFRRFQVSVDQAAPTGE